MKRIALALALGLCVTAPAVAQNAETLPLVGVLRINSAANKRTSRPLQPKRNA
jgi:hypothetical protein